MKETTPTAMPPCFDRWWKKFPGVNFSDILFIMLAIVQTKEYCTLLLQGSVVN